MSFHSSYFAKFKNTLSNLQNEVASATKQIEIEDDVKKQSSSKKDIDKEDE